MTDREKLISTLKKTPIAQINGHIAEAEVCFVYHVFESMADHLIANGVTFATDNNVGTWIPVTDRLPEVGERCLCNVKSFAFPGSFYQAILKYDKYGFVEGCI